MGWNVVCNASCAVLNLGRSTAPTGGLTYFMAHACMVVGLLHDDTAFAALRPIYSWPEPQSAIGGYN
jgi:hypothetical protein